ncbi:hypothetical protein [Shewanella sp. MF08487]|uniref:hypothetical protein n=1 Tax=Shewanella sp. MF08487 TaxID=3434873 RepID=UPI003D7B410C
MKVLSVISILLDNPHAELLDARAELEAIVTGSELDAAHQALVLHYRRAICDGYHGLASRI